MYRASILDTNNASSNEHPVDVQEAIKSCFENGNAAFETVNELIHQV